MEHAETVHQQEESHHGVSAEETQNAENEVTKNETVREVACGSLFCMSPAQTETAAPVHNEEHPIIVEPAVSQQLPEESIHESVTEVANGFFRI